jgi:hypothetical protein
MPLIVAVIYIFSAVDIGTKLPRKSCYEIFPRNRLQEGSGIFIKLG